MNQQKILIIDDEFPMRYLIEHQLRREGYDVNLAKDGPSGIKAAQMHQPDLIVLDAMMPGMDGFEVCNEIRNDPGTTQIPIIFLTALETKEYKSKAYEAGADDYLTKPFQSDELIAHVSAILRRSKRIQTGIINTKNGSIVSLFSPKGGVGTTTLSIQLSEAITIQEDKPTVLIDLDLPLGGVAPMLNLYTNDHILKLLDSPVEHLSMSQIKQMAQKHRADLFVIPAPGILQTINFEAKLPQLEKILTDLSTNGYQVILDLGSDLNVMTKKAMQLSNSVFIITSGQPVANKLYNAFFEQSHKLGLQPNQLLPVINELHGQVDNVVSLPKLPIARIPQTSERSRTRLWLKEQGMRKLMSVMF
ncbi:MAG: response regulator [Chloroflexota bacterium]